MLDSLSDSDFSPHIGAEFTVARGEDRRCVLRLVTVTTLADTGAPGRRQPFALYFHGSPDLVLPQATYRLENAVFDPLEIFLVPIGRDAAAVRYEAIFT